MGPFNKGMSSAFLKRSLLGASRLMMGLADWGRIGKVLQHSDESVFFSLLKTCVLWKI